MQNWVKSGTHWVWKYPKCQKCSSRYVTADLNRTDKIGVETVRGECRRELEQMNVNKDVRLRSYQTLGFCAGAAVAILLI